MGHKEGVPRVERQTLKINLHFLFSDMLIALQKQFQLRGNTSHCWHIIRKNVFFEDPQCSLPSVLLVQGHKWAFLLE